jgi:hypothetical protein
MFLFMMRKFKSLVLQIHITAHVSNKENKYSIPQKLLVTFFIFKASVSQSSF